MFVLVVLSSILTPTQLKEKAVLSQGEPRDAAVNFDTYRILRIGFSATARLFCIHQWPIKCWNYTVGLRWFSQPKITAHDQNHGKSHGDHDYVIILQR